MAQNGSVVVAIAGTLLFLHSACSKPLPAQPSPSHARAAEPPASGVWRASAESPLSLALGQRHSCMLDSRDGKVRCWGDNRDGQLGDGTNVPRLEPIEVSGLPPVRRIAAGRGHNCALARSGEVFCWGLNVSGQAGPGSGDARFTPTPVPGLSGVVLVSSIVDTSCALTSDARVLCWGAVGSNVDPSGTAGPTSGEFGRPLLLAEGAAEMALNRGGLCLRTHAGEVACISALAPRRRVEITGLRGPVRLADGLPCAIAESKTNYCWDLNLSDEELAQPESARISRSAQPTAWAPGAEQLVEGTVVSSRCAVLDSGRVQCTPPRAVPPEQDKQAFWLEYNARDVTATATLTHVLALATSGWQGEHACAVLADNELRCWGESGVGQTGTGIGVYTAAQELTMLRGATAIGMGRGHACALVGGRALCWGDGAAGQLGPSLRSSAEPIAIAGVEGGVGLAVASNRTCAATQHEGVLCWGGAFGATPLKVPGLSHSVEAAIGDHVVCGRQDSGRTRCTDYVEADPSPAVGNPFRATREVFKDARQIAANELEVCARPASGAVTCWDRFPRTPATIPALKDVVSIDLEGERGCALDRSGRLYCWEWNRNLVESKEYDGKRPELYEPGAAHRRIANGALLSTGDGYNDCVALGDGNVRCFDDEAGPLQEAQVPGLVISGVTHAIALRGGWLGGRTTNCAITRDARVLCWHKQAATVSRPAKVRWR